MAPRFVRAQLAMAAVVLSMAACGGVAAHRPSASHPAGSSAQVNPLLARNYRILRRAVRNADRLPALYRGASGRHRLPPSLLPALARRAEIPGTKLEMWLVPGSANTFCVVEAERTARGPVTGGFGTTCGPVRPIMTMTSLGGGAPLAAGPPIRPLAPGEPEVLYGLAPDSVTALTVVAKGGAATPVSTSEGMFAVRLPRGARVYGISDGHRIRIAVASG